MQKSHLKTGAQAVLLRRPQQIGEKQNMETGSGSEGSWQNSKYDWRENQTDQSSRGRLPPLFILESNISPPVSDPCCFPLGEMLDKYFSVRQGSNLRVRHGLILPRWHGCVATTESMWSSFWETGKGFGMLTHLGRWWQKHLFVLAIGDEKLSSENYH